jgi:hypothetical protein
MDMRMVLALAVAEICFDPAKPCPGFREHDLSFVREAGGVARAEERSAPFHAVILVSGPRCEISESERKQAQRLFPGRKVFSSRFQCDDDIENNVRYTNFDERRAFVAVYGAPAREEAEKVAADARTKGYPGANVRLMQAVLVHP